MSLLVAKELKLELDEAKLIKAIDKIKATLQQTEMSHDYYDRERPKLMATYPDKALAIHPELKELVILIKKELKEKFIKGNIPWKEEYDKV